MSMKKLIVLLVLVVVGVVVYQVGSFVVYYAKVKAELDNMIYRFPILGEEAFRDFLVSTYHERVGLELHPADVMIDVDREKRTVRVEFTFVRELRLLFLSFDKQLRVWRSYKDVDIT